MASTQASVVYDFGDDQFVLKSVPKPAPGPNCALVHVQYCGLNPVDAKIGQWKSMIDDSELARHPRGESFFVPGLDVVGTVVGHGEGVDQPPIGTRVFYHGRMLEPYGGLSPFSVHEASTLIPLRPSWSATLDGPSLAAIPCAAWTAMKIVRDKCRVQKDDVVLVYGASGGVGSFSVQFARLLGAATIIGVCSSKNVTFARECGCDHVVDYTDLGEHSTVRDAVLALTHGRGVDKAIDLVGQETSEVCADLLAFDGVVCCAVSLAKPSKTRDQFGRGVSFSQVSLGAAHRADDVARSRLVSLAEATMDAIVDGRVHVPVSRVITLEEAPGVLADMVHAHTRGKIVVRVDDDEAVSPVAQRADGKVVDSPSTNKSTRMTAVCGVTITDREQFDSLVQDMIKLERTTPGTLQLEWFVDEENPAEAVLLESFENEEAQLQHMKNFFTFRDRFGCMHFHTFRYFGAVTPSVRERIAKHPFKFYQTAAELRR